MGNYHLVRIGILSNKGVFTERRLRPSEFNLTGNPE